MDRLAQDSVAWRSGSRPTAAGAAYRPERHDRHAQLGDQPRIEAPLPLREWSVAEFLNAQPFAGEEVVLPGSGNGCLLILQLEGCCSVVQERAEVTLRPLSILMLDAALRARLRPGAHAHTRLLRLPRPAGRAACSAGCLHDAQSGIGRALHALIACLADRSHLFGPGERHGLQAAVMALAAAVVLREPPEVGLSRSSTPRCTPTIALLQATVEKQLADPGLSPARVAALHGISTRHLHRLFRSAGISFSAFVRMRRLDRCRADLADARFGGLPLTQIAFRWGFSDSAHFSRCFRAAYGCTASDFRMSRAAPRRSGR